MPEDHEISRTKLEYAKYQQSLVQKEMLEFLVGEQMKATAERTYVILNVDRQVMKDPGMNRPFMTSNKRQADHVRDEACRAGFKCEVFKVADAIPILMNEAGKTLGKS